MVVVLPLFSSLVFVLFGLHLCWNVWLLCSLYGSGSSCSSNVFILGKIERNALNDYFQFEHGMKKKRKKQCNSENSSHWNEGKESNTRFIRLRLLHWFSVGRKHIIIIVVEMITASSIEYTDFRYICLSIYIHTLFPVLFVLSFYKRQNVVHFLLAIIHTMMMMMIRIIMICVCKHWIFVLNIKCLSFQLVLHIYFK